MTDPGIVSIEQPSTLDCPVDFVKVDENRVRVVAFFVLVLVLAYILTGSPVVIAALLTDFLIRSFNQNRLSPLALLGGAIAKVFNFKPKPVDRAPKRFAAFVGVALLVAILVMWFTGFILTSKIIAAVMIAFASLESFFGFCAGCYVYSFLGHFKK